MKYERWLIPETDDAAVEALMDAGYPYLVSTVLASRGVVTPEQAAAHLDRERSLVYSPFLMRDMDKAVARIDRALAGGETIAVFGDYDVDGITSTCLLTDYLRSRGAAVLMHIPRRIEEGYGLGCDAIRALAEQGVTLIVTVDCGITGVEEVDFANSLGMDVIITDHHECKETLPHAAAVVDPHRPDCGYPFKHLAGCGVALKLVLAESDTSSGTFAAVSDKQALIGGLLDADGAVTMDIPVAGGEAQIGIDLTGCKRFVKITGTVSFTGGTTPAATATYALALGDPAQEPVE